MALFSTNKYKSKTVGRGLSCVSCGLYKDAKNPKMKPKGKFEKKILIIDSAPSILDDKRNNVYQSPEGAFLQQILNKHDIDIWDDCAVTYAVSCTTNGGAIPPQAVLSCRKRLIANIKEMKPKLVLILGQHALTSVIGYRTTKNSGSIDKFRGLHIPDQEFNAWICPTYSPKFMLSQSKFPEMLITYKNDIESALKQLKSPIPHYSQDEAHINILEDAKDVTKALLKIKRFAPVVTFDLETTGLKPYAGGHQIACISLAINSKEAIVFEFPEKGTKNWKLLKNIIADKKIGKIAQNMKFEDTWMHHFEMPVTNWVWDTMQATHILDNRQGITGLKFQTYVQLGLGDYSDIAAPYLVAENSNAINKVMNAMSKKETRKSLMLYCGIDSLNTHRIYENQQKVICFDEVLNKGYQLMHNGILSLARAERFGIRIDEEYLTIKINKVEKQVKHLTKKLEATDFIKNWKKSYRNTFNMNSDKQLANYLFNTLKYKPKKFTEKGSPSTDEESLSLMHIPEVDSILKIRKLDKLKGTYLQGFATETTNGKMHPFFNLHTVQTYRSSSQNPNFQNIPKRDKKAMKLIRGSMFARTGHQLMEADFSKLEVSIAACYHKDPVMLGYLTSDHNDMHGDLAAQIYKIKNFDKHNKYHSVLRASAKNGFIFPQFYGDYYKNCADGLRQWIKLDKGRWSGAKGVEVAEGVHIAEHMNKQGIKSYADFEEHIRKIEDDFWNNRFKVYGKWKTKHIKTYHKTGEIEMLSGFRLTNPMRKNAVINYPVQGAAFHCLLWTFIELDKQLLLNKMDTKIIGQIHDAIILDVHPDELDKISYMLVDIATKQLPKAFEWINVPLQIEAELCDVDASWDKKYDYELPRL